MKVKNSGHWDKLVFSDTVILKNDLKYMSLEQKDSLNELNVIRSDRGKVLYISEENKVSLPERGAYLV